MIFVYFICVDFDYPNDIAELASIDSKSESVATGNLSRANTDLLPQNQD